MTTNKRFVNNTLAVVTGRRLLSMASSQHASITTTSPRAIISSSRTPTTSQATLNDRHPDLPVLLPSSSASCRCCRQRRRSYNTTAHRDAWWNPFVKSGIRDSTAKLGSSQSPKALSAKEDADEHPRRIQERKDGTLLLLALAFHRLATTTTAAAAAAAAATQGQSQPHSQPSLMPEIREQLIDQAFEALDEMEVDAKTLLQLRQTVQSALEPQVMDLLRHFRMVDDDLFLLERNVTTSAADDNDDDNDNDDDGNTPVVNPDALYDGLVRLELERTIDQLTLLATANNDNDGDVEAQMMRAPKGADPSEFLTLKRGALETLLDRRRRQQEHAQVGSDATRSDDDETSPPQLQSQSQPHASAPSSWVDADAFGYHETIDAERNRLIRHYQAINVCRAAKLRETWGFSVVALQSSIPGAGRGVYVDGYARAGSILAFQPGLVWPKEHLVNLTVDEDRDLERNDAYQMSLRADDIMIDSRKSPYTVLSEEGSNMMAVGHIVNHPTPTRPPNARSAMLDFTQNMLEEEGRSKSSGSASLRRYIPNTYAKPRNRGLLSGLLDREMIEMHSMVLVATRDICNEEIFYDYRLATGHLPQWYHPVQDTAYVEGDGAEEEEKVEGQDGPKEEPKK